MNTGEAIVFCLLIATVVFICLSWIARDEEKYK